jgi:hypothetical protein
MRPLALRSRARPPSRVFTSQGCPSVCKVFILWQGTHIHLSAWQALCCSVRGSVRLSACVTGGAGQLQQRQLESSASAGIHLLFRDGVDPDLDAGGHQHHIAGDLRKQLSHQLHEHLVRRSQETCLTRRWGSPSGEATHDAASQILRQHLGWGEHDRRRPLVSCCQHGFSNTWTAPCLDARRMWELFNLMAGRQGIPGIGRSCYAASGRCSRSEGPCARRS